MEEFDQKVANVFHQFGISIPCLTAYFWEVGAHVSLKVATKVSPRSQKTLKSKVIRLPI